MLNNGWKGSRGGEESRACERLSSNRRTKERHHQVYRAIGVESSGLGRGSIKYHQGGSNFTITMPSSANELPRFPHFLWGSFT